MSASPSFSGNPPGAVRVRLFSVLREKVGRPELHLPLPAPVDGAALLDRLAEEHPTLADYRQTVRLAVGKRYVDENATVHPGDEVALITPVSGG